MFFVLSKTPKEQKRLGKNSASGKGIKKSAFVLICIAVAFIAFGIIMGNTVEPGTSKPSNSDDPVNTLESIPEIKYANAEEEMIAKLIKDKNGEIIGISSLDATDGMVINAYIA